MSMVNVEFRDIITLLIPPHKRTPKLLAFLQVMISPLVTLYNTFKSYREDTLYEINYDGSTIHLEHFLNIEFGGTLGTGITIETNQTTNPFFISDKAYGLDPVFIYSKWKSDQAYSPDDRVRYKSKYYKALKSSTGAQPDISPSSWEETADAIYVGDKTYYDSQYDFTVKIPALLYSTLDEKVVRSFIDKYRLAGKNYNIISV